MLGAFSNPMYLVTRVALLPTHPSILFYCTFGLILIPSEKGDSQYESEWSEIQKENWSCAIVT